MYPKVKVRAEDEEDDDCSKHRHKHPLQGFNSLSISDSTLPVKGVKHSTSVSVAKVPKSYIPRSITPPPLPKSAKNSELEPDGKKPRIRASSIPRPRAVISSPDNDQILGSKNKTRLQRPSAMKNHDLAKSRQSQETCTQTSTTSKKLCSGGVCKLTNAGDVKAQKEPGVHVRVPTTKISKGKPCFQIT